MNPRLLLHTLLVLLGPLTVLGNVAAATEGGSRSPEGKTHSQLLSEANVFLTTGRYADALSSFDSALALDPSDYLTYYRRATALLSLGRTGSALADLEKLLELNPSFATAWLQKARVFAKEGELGKAKESVGKFLGRSSTSKAREAEEAEKLQADISWALQKQKEMQAAHKAGAASVTKALKKNPETASQAVKVDSSLQQKAEQCVEAATAVLEVSPSHLQARKFRADCQLWRGNMEDATADWSRIAKLTPSTSLHLRLSALSFYIQSDVDAAKLHLKTCLHSDPDNKRCAQAHRKLKTYEKTLKKLHNFREGGNWRAVSSVLKGGKVGGLSIREEIEAYIRDELMKPVHGGAALEGDEPLIPLLLHDAVARSELLFGLTKTHCKAHLELSELAKAMPFCQQVLSRDPDDIDALTARGEEHMAHERHEDAVRDFSAAFSKTGNSDRGLHARLIKAQKRLKLANTKDYYAILGVPRSADAREIKKAYRNLAREHHPDKGGSQDKMAQINEAFGVLGDDELRTRYDAGDDPNDPMGQQGQQGGYGNPFVFQTGPGGMPFGGGGGGGAGGHPFAHFFQQGGPAHGHHAGSQQQQFRFNFG
ncbi:TPR-like protein [Tilletiaria anomala UBC 951]|uniref:TPR-like protein n=1 Tax=Tilletiaria anomala (strain ATCC 24038 / CBS 436.72 / UBC 951) TaxID=1037660 RepID=A0A066W7H5_TILAU|nr:TPR-like protein [Tilletiaria anomala UBC 951]KDN48488.1 TPR-like protein [Tilletiaria anomala UBC 951]